MEGEGIETFAARLGIGSRQLRRLFLRHLGASPRAVMQTRRLHFAKKLIDETSLTMGQIAMAAGFGSVRRFNAAFRETYSRTPTQIRRLAHFHSSQAECEYHFRLGFRPPFHWDALLDFLGRRATHARAQGAVYSGDWQRLAELGNEIQAMTPGELATFLAKEDQTVAELAKTGLLKPE